MNNYFDSMNMETFISSDAFINSGLGGILVVEESQAERFGRWLRDARTQSGMKKAELARKAKIARSYVSNLEGVTANVLTEKPTLPSVEIVDRIATALDLPIAEARSAAGYAAPATEATLADIELQRLGHFYKDLPRECQLDFLALAESLWRRRRAEGRAEKALRRSAGKHRPQTVKPGVERRPPKRKAS